jgi:plasmid maintenance system killer protein
MNGVSAKNIAIEEGITERNVMAACARIRNRAAKQGFSPEHDMVHTVPDGFTVKGVSTYYDDEGRPRGQWVKSQSDRERQLELLLEAIEQAHQTIPPFDKIEKPKRSDKNLLSLLTVTDFHLGMYAWEAETGESWDIKIARDTFMNAVADMIDSCPNSHYGLFCQLGDFLHFDGLLAMTPSSGHILDADSRYGKLVELTIEVMTEATKMMLERFPEVVVVQAEGNHDMASSVWLRKHIKHVFKNNNRLTVIDNEFPYYAHLHGETMLAFHHGHKKKLGDLHKLFASEPRFRSMWGQAKQTYIHAGHYHHEKVVEDAGAIAEQHPTLSARDAYAARGGWVSMRGAKVITYDKFDGEIHRTTVRPR